MSVLPKWIIKDITYYWNFSEIFIVISLAYHVPLRTMLKWNIYDFVLLSALLYVFTVSMSVLTFSHSSVIFPIGVVVECLPHVWKVMGPILARVIPNTFKLYQWLSLLVTRDCVCKHCQWLDDFRINRPVILVT